MKRGWILFWSVMVELGILIGPVLLILFFWPKLAIFVIFGEIITLGITGFLLIYFWWAPNNLFFTFVPEGRAKAVVRGDAFKKTLMQWQGYGLATTKVPDGSVDTGDISVDIGDIIEMPSPRRFFGALNCYGFWPLDDIYVYSFGWTDFLSDGQIQPHPERDIDYIVLKTTLYYTKVAQAEDKQKLPLDVELVLTVRITNPYKALFRGQNWLEYLISTIQPAVTAVLKRKTYEAWIEGQEGLGKEILDALQTDGLIDRFKKDYGISLLNLGVKDINPGEKFREITVKKVTAEREKEATIVAASAEQTRIETVYKTVEKFGDVGKLVRALEALEKSPGQGAKWVIPIPGFTELISAAFPGRRTETLQSGEVKELIDGLKQLTEALKEQIKKAS